MSINKNLRLATDLLLLVTLGIPIFGDDDDDDRSDSVVENDDDDDDD